MLNFFLSGGIVAIPIVLFAFGIALISIAVAVGKKKRQEAEKWAARQMQNQQQRINSAKNTSQSKKCDVHTHVGNRAIARDGHEHFGSDEERYDKIVGSLGEVDDEGCDDMDGIRLIAHDEAYDVDVENGDYSEIVKAMVLGEAIGNPSFKKRRRK